MPKCLISFPKIQSVEELKSSLDSLPAELRARLMGEIRLVLTDLSQEQEKGLAELAS